MKKFFVIFSMAVFAVSNIHSQQLGDLYTEKSAGFTMSIPLGWQTFDFNQKYLMVVGPEENGFTPNIGFGDEEFGGSLSDYIDAVMALLQLFYSDIVEIERSGIKTYDGANGEMICYLCTLGTVRMRQRIYVIPSRSSDAVMSISCTAPVDSGDRWDSVFDAAVKTFSWVR